MMQARGFTAPLTYVRGSGDGEHSHRSHERWPPERKYDQIPKFHSDIDCLSAGLFVPVTEKYIVENSKSSY
jgi:hypothetical protein